MTKTASARETKRTGAFASLWLILRHIFALMGNPARLAEANALMADAETQAAFSILRHALANDPNLAGLTVDDFEVVRLFDARGHFDPDFRLKPHVLAARQQAHAQALADSRKAWREHYLKLRQVRRVKQAVAWRTTLQGIPWFKTRMALLDWRERNRADASRRAPSCVRARSVMRAAPLTLVPP